MAAACPAPASPLRAPGDCGYGEIPGVAHQGGSSLAVSKYSKNKDAAWLFAQWATSYETQVYITALGGGTGPTRASVYDDERVKANNRSGNGTTRHLDVVRDAIFNDIEQLFARASTGFKGATMSDFYDEQHLDLQTPVLELV